MISVLQLALHREERHAGAGNDHDDPCQDGCSEDPYANDAKNTDNQCNDSEDHKCLLCHM